MSTPKDQAYGAGGRACETYSSIHAVEGLYTYYYNFGSSKLSLNPNTTTQSSTPNSVLNGIMNDGVKDTSDVYTFPNYEYAIFPISNHRQITSDKLNNLKTQLDDTPVIMEIKYFVGSGADTDALNYEPNSEPIDHTASSGYVKHYVAVVDWGTWNGIEYLECMNNYGSAHPDSGFFKIKTADFNTWCGTLDYPTLHTGTTYKH